MSVAKAITEAITEGGKQIFKRLKPKKTFSKNIGIGKIKQEGLYKTVGKDKYGNIDIITKGPQKGYRVPLEGKGFTERRPWSADPDYKPSPEERVPSPQSGPSVEKQMKKFEKKAMGGRIMGYQSGGKVCKLAVKGKGRAYGKNS